MFLPVVNNGAWFFFQQNSIHPNQLGKLIYIECIDTLDFRHYIHDNYILQICKTRDIIRGTYLPLENSFYGLVD